MAPNPRVEVSVDTNAVAPAARPGSVKAFDSANVINDRSWFAARKAEGFELYVMHATRWGSCEPWERTRTQLRMALDAGLRVGIYTRDPRCWAGGIDAAGPLSADLQFFALDVELDPGVRITRDMVDGIVARGVRPVVYSGAGMWSRVMNGNVGDYADLPLWDTDASEIDLRRWVPDVATPAALPYGGWNAAGNPRVIVQQAFEVPIDGVYVDLNSVRADFLR